MTTRTPEPEEVAASEADPWVFRDGRRALSGPKLLRELRTSVWKCVNRAGDNKRQLNALIRAGELESALSDVGSSAAPGLANLTDGLAAAMFGGDASWVEKVASSLDQLLVPESLMMSPPEGFSYYALQPADFGRLAARVGTGGRPAAVIGIRSIGTTLSAVVSAALKTTGVPVNRITVRPTGHPYHRVTHFTEQQASWIKKRQGNSAEFLVVDEGPGRSGSTFLSVAEALVEAGVPYERIRLLGSRQPDLSLLCARGGARRWSRFRFEAAVADSGSRFGAHTYAGGGEWRNFLLADAAVWPACWPQMERLKFLSPNRDQFIKFEGLGRLGEAVLERSRCLWRAGFGRKAEEMGDGFVSYALITGRPLKANDVSTGVLERMAEYCAFRSTEFRFTDSRINGPPPEALAEMVGFNLGQEFGLELPFDAEALQPTRVVLADGRMQPHEWIRSEEGVLLKTDASTHGDDHFFPGPCDIAWDLAGAAVEWDLHPNAFEFLLRRLQSLTGEDPRPRLPAYLLAYLVFRVAWCKMALTTVAGSPEELRLQRAYRNYRRQMKQQISTWDLPGASKTSSAESQTFLGAA